MDNEALAKLLAEDPTLRQLLSDPELQASIKSLLEQEIKFQEHQARYASQNHHRQNRYNRNNKSAGFPNPNNAPLSPLETKLIEGKESKEQQALRLILEHLKAQ